MWTSAQQQAELKARAGMLALYYRVGQDDEDWAPVPGADEFSASQRDAARKHAETFCREEVLGQFFNVIIVDEEGSVLDEVGDF